MYTSSWGGAIRTALSHNDILCFASNGVFVPSDYDPKVVESESESEGLDLKVLDEWFGEVGRKGS